MREKNIATGLALIGVLTSGCSEAGVKNADSISECEGRGTNLEPTYLPSDENYSENTDPHKLVELQSQLGESIQIQGLRGSYTGLGTIVCREIIGTPDWWSGKTPQGQFLTQHAIDLAKQMHSASSDTE